MTEQLTPFFFQLWGKTAKMITELNCHKTRMLSNFYKLAIPSAEKCFLNIAIKILNLICFTLSEPSKKTSNLPNCMKVHLEIHHQATLIRGTILALLVSENVSRGGKDFPLFKDVYFFSFSCE